MSESEKEVAGKVHGRGQCWVCHRDQNTVERDGVEYIAAHGNPRCAGSARKAPPPRFPVSTGGIGGVTLIGYYPLAATARLEAVAREHGYDTITITVDQSERQEVVIRDAYLREITRLPAKFYPGGSCWDFPSDFKEGT